MIDWWTIGIRWRDRHASIVHGDVVRAAAAFARQEAGERAITPNTLRGYMAAAVFVERLRAEGLVDDAGKGVLTRLPLKVVAALQRTSRYGKGELRELLAIVLAKPWILLPELLGLEAEVRKRAAGSVNLEANTHAFRLRSVSFRSGALAMLAAEGAEGGRRFVPVRPPTRFEPFVVDAIAAASGGYWCVRLITETAGTTIRPRLGDAFLQAIAAARAFEAVILVTEASGDADGLASRVARLGKCGIGVSWYDPGQGIDVRCMPERSRRPDLAGRYAEEFAAASAPGPSLG